MPVVFMTGYGDIPMSVQAMKAGAVDFLPKPFREQDLLDAVNSPIERDRLRRQAEDDLSLLIGRYHDLTERERQVMKLVTSGRLSLNKASVFVNRRKNRGRYSMMITPD